MKYAPASKNKVDLIRSSVTVNALVLTGLKAVEIAKIIRGIKKRYLLHLLGGKPNQIADVFGFHSKNPKFGVSRLCPRKNKNQIFGDIGA
jgi:hypothetical protein